MEIQKTKEFAKRWIEEGRPCERIHGLEYRGARPRPITNEQAMEMLPMYGFGMGYHELDFVYSNGRVVLRFEEYSESDLY